ncbi:hypothetical protein CRUP_001609 [Coryphaenoides rupestris]|nr:hypothetical protein CRUP_001609 [Coryphaenoides rupestris]
MSDNEKDYGARKARSASRSVSPRGSGKSASRTPTRSTARSKEGSRKSRSRSKSGSASHRGSRRRYSRSHSRSNRRRSRSRSYSGERRRRSHSRSPMSNRRRHIGNRRDLRDVFSKYGPLADVCIVYDQQVDFSITKRPHTPTPGIYMGRPTYGGGGSSSGGGGGGGSSGGAGPSGPRRYSRDYDRGGYDDREYCNNRSYRRRSPSPYYRGTYRSRSRSRSYSPRRY